MKHASLFPLLLLFLAGGSPLPLGAVETPHEKGTAALVLTRREGSSSLVVDYVAQGGPAALAGIHEGETVATLNGLLTGTMTGTQWREILEGEVGATVDLAIVHDGAPAEIVSVVLRPLVEAYLPAAEGGDPKAQFRIAYYYDQSPAPVKDQAKAAEWYRKAAESDYSYAETNLGILHRYGRGIPKDPAAAFAWFVKASGHDDPAGERERALCHLKGEGTPKDERAAFAWFYRAAEQGDVSSEYWLGMLYLKGRGVEKYPAAAFHWFTVAARHNNPYAAWILGDMYSRGDGVKRDFAASRKWLGQAEQALPDDRALKRTMALADLRAFLHGNDLSHLDTVLIKEAFGSGLVWLFGLLAGIYAVGVAFLLYLTLRGEETSTRGSVAVGWIFFFFESQGMTLFGLGVLAKAVGVGAFLAATVFCCSVPLIVSSLGAARSRLWGFPRIPAARAFFRYFLLPLFAVYLVDFVYALAYQAIFHKTLPGQSTREVIAQAKQLSPWLAFLGVSLLMPAAEEILFRGYLFDAVGRRFPSRVAIGVTGFTFAAAHLQPEHFIPLLGLGLVLGWLRKETTSLWMPWLLHAFNNALVLMVARS